MYEFRKKPNNKQAIIKPQGLYFQQLKKSKTNLINKLIKFYTTQTNCC